MYIYIYICIYSDVFQRYFDFQVLIHKHKRSLRVQYCNINMLHHGIVECNGEMQCFTLQSAAFSPLLSYLFDSLQSVHIPLSTSIIDMC